MSTQQSLTSVDSQAIHLQDLSKPRIAELVELVRLLRAVINAFRMYPPGNQMIQRSVDRFARGMTTLCDSLGQLVLSFVSDTIELNGEPVPRTAAESRLASELAKIFMARGVNTVLFDKNTKVKEFADWLAFISRQDVEDDDASFRVDLQQSNFPHLRINRQVVTRHTSDQMRDKLSVREIVASMDRDSLLKELGLDDEQLAPEFLEALEQPAQPQGVSEASSGIMQGLEGRDDKLGAKGGRQIDALLRSGRFSLTLIKREARVQRERALRQAISGSSRSKAGTSPLLSSVETRGRGSASQGGLPLFTGQYNEPNPKTDPLRGMSRSMDASLPTYTGSIEREGIPELSKHSPTGSSMQVLPRSNTEVLEGFPVPESSTLPRSGSRGLLEVLNEGVSKPSGVRSLESENASPSVVGALGEPGLGVGSLGVAGSSLGGALPWQGDLPARGGGALHTQGVTSVPLDPSMFLPADLFSDASSPMGGGFSQATAPADPLLDALSEALAQRQDLFPEGEIEESQLSPEDRLQLPSLAELLAAADRDTRVAQNDEMSVEMAEALAQLLSWQDQLSHATKFSQEKLPHPASEGASLGLAVRPLDVSTNSLDMFDVTRQAEEAASFSGADISGADQDVGGFVDLTVSLDNLDAADARDVIESRSPHEVFAADATQPSLHAPPLPSFDEIDWAQVATIPMERWPQQLRVEELVQSQRIAELIQQPNFPSYLRASLEGARKRVVSEEDAASLVSPATQKTIQQDLERFGQAVMQLQDDFLRRTFMLGVLQQIASLDEPLIAQYWLQASPEDSFGKALRRGLLQALPASSIQGVQRDLLSKIQHSPNRELLESALSLSKDIVDAQLQTSSWDDVRKMVALLEERSRENPSRRLLYSLRELLGHLKTHHRMTHVLREGMHPQASEARALLAELAPESLPLCARFLIKSPAGPLREQQAEIFAQVAQQADAARVSSAFHIIFEFFDHHPPALEMWQLFCEIARSCAPEALESVILDHLQHEQSPRSLHLWVTQALLHHSARIQWWLDQCLRQRALNHLPHLEDLIFSAWLRAGYLDGLSFLREEIFNTHRTSSQRHHAVWLIGSLPSEEGRSLFEEMLFSPSAASLGERLRFQLMYTLWWRGQGAWRRSMMQKLASDESSMIRLVASGLLQQAYPGQKPQTSPGNKPQGVSGGILPPDEILLAPVEMISKVPLFQPMPPGALTQEMQKIAARGQQAPSTKPPTSPGTRPPTSPGAASPARPSAGYAASTAGQTKTGTQRPPTSSSAKPPSSGVSGGVLALGFFAMVFAVVALLYLYFSAS